VASSARALHWRLSWYIDAMNGHPFGRAPPCLQRHAGVLSPPVPSARLACEKSRGMPTIMPTIKRSRAHRAPDAAERTPALVNGGICCRLAHRGRTPEVFLWLSATGRLREPSLRRAGSFGGSRKRPRLRGKDGAVRRAHCLVRSSRRSTGPCCQSHAAL
jgi:hypothetical protein